MPDAKFWRAPQVEAIARELIPKYHQHLSVYQVPIRFLFRDDIPKSGGKEKWGEARKVTGLQAFLAGSVGEEGETIPFFVLTITEPRWKVMTENQRRALVDHELSHMDATVDDEGDLKLTINPHDLEEFADVARRYGDWNADLRRFLQAASESVQVSMELEEATA